MRNKEEFIELIAKTLYITTEQATNMYNISEEVKRTESKTKQSFISRLIRFKL